MRNRYVLQILLATFGSGMLLAAMAVLETPPDRSLRVTDAPRATAESPQCHASEPPAHTPKATPGKDDFKGECEVLDQLISD